MKREPLPVAPFILEHTLLTLLRTVERSPTLPLAIGDRAWLRDVYFRVTLDKAPLSRDDCYRINALQAACAGNLTARLSR